jgi:hypothetical protein
MILAIITPKPFYVLYSFGRCGRCGRCGMTVNLRWGEGKVSGFCRVHDTFGVANTTPYKIY